MSTETDRPLGLGLSEGLGPNVTMPEPAMVEENLYGERKADEALAREKERAEQAVQRAERTEKQQGLGHCEDCSYWQRGGQTPNPERCAWGICKAPVAAGTPWGTWASADSAVRNVSIQTTQRFGCVVFMASNVLLNGAP